MVILPHPTWKKVPLCVYVFREGLIHCNDCVGNLIIGKWKQYSVSFLVELFDNYWYVLHIKIGKGILFC